MARNVGVRALCWVVPVALAAALGFGYMRYKAAEGRQRQVRSIGAEWQQLYQLPQADYVRLISIKDSVVKTRSIDDSDLDWLLDQLGQGKNTVVRARILGVISTATNSSEAQKRRIAPAVIPLLQSRDALDRHYAASVQRKLRLAGAGAR